MLTPPPAPVPPDYKYPSLFKRDKRWKYATQSNEEIFFYDKKKIKKRGGIITVWIRAEPLFKTTTYYEWDQEKYRKRPHQVTKEEYDCNQEKRRVLSSIEYDVDGKVIGNYDFQNPEWKSIPPESVGEEMLKKFCTK